MLPPLKPIPIKDRLSVLHSQAALGLTAFCSVPHMRGDEPIDPVKKREFPYYQVADILFVLS